MSAKVSDFMTHKVEVLSPDATLQDAVRLEMLNKIRHIPIVADGALIGIISDRDLRRAMPSALSASGRDDHQEVMRETKLSQIMTRDPVTITADAPLVDAVGILCEKKFGALPVMSGPKIIGIITQKDLLRAFRQLLQHKWW